MKPFSNEPHAELRRAPVREGLVTALRDLESGLPWSVPVWIGDERTSGEDLVSTDPGDPERVVATSATAAEAQVDRAVETAGAGMRDWGRRPAHERAAALVAAANALRLRRPQLAALAVRECAKPWPEADADVCEAIDFLEYYARQALELEPGRPLLAAPGERNAMRYAPRGVCAAIAPVELPACDPHRHGGRRACGGQHGDPEAGGAVTCVRARLCRGVA